MFLVIWCTRSHPFSPVLTRSYFFFLSFFSLFLLQGVKEFSVPVGLDSKVQVDLLVVGSVAVSEKGESPQRELCGQWTPTLVQESSSSAPTPILLGLISPLLSPQVTG